MKKSEKPEPIGKLPPEGAFVVQLRADAECESARFSGRVEHVVTGRAARFRSVGELHAFIVRVLGALAAVGDAEKPNTTGELPGRAETAPETDTAQRKE
jgi:hypothetical protein